MKHRVLIISGLTLITIFASPAHAISEKYKQQLERSGCTQVTDGNGCDITKTKAENMKTMPQSELNELTEFLHDSVIGQKTDVAYDALTGYGYEGTEPGVWKKGKTTIVLDIQNDHIKYATIKP